MCGSQEKRAAVKSAKKAKKAAKRNDASGKAQDLPEDSPANMSSTDNLPKLGENGKGILRGAVGCSTRE